MQLRRIDLQDLHVENEHARLLKALEHGEKRSPADYHERVDTMALNLTPAAKPSSAGRKVNQDAIDAVGASIDAHAGFEFPWADLGKSFEDSSRALREAGYQLGVSLNIRKSGDDGLWFEAVPLRTRSKKNS